MIRLLSFILSPPLSIAIATPSNCLLPSIGDHPLFLSPNSNLARSLLGASSRRHECGVPFESGTFVLYCPGRSEELVLGTPRLMTRMAACKARRALGKGSLR